MDPRENNPLFCGPTSEEDSRIKSQIFHTTNLDLPEIPLPTLWEFTAWTSRRR
jgi:hypothetical protein